MVFEKQKWNPALAPVKGRSDLCIIDRHIHVFRMENEPLFAYTTWRVVALSNLGMTSVEPQRTNIYSVPSPGVVKFWLVFSCLTVMVRGKPVKLQRAITYFLRSELQMTESRRSMRAVESSYLPPSSARPQSKGQIKPQMYLQGFLTLQPTSCFHLVVLVDPYFKL